MNTELVNTMYGSFYGFQGDLMTKRLKQLGAYERNDLAMALAFLRPGDIVLDVGGNIGTFAIPVALKVGEKGKVYTFEGNQQTYAVLSQNIAINNLKNRIQAIQSIVTNKPGNYTLMNPDPQNMRYCYFQIDDKKSDIFNNTCIVLDNWLEDVDETRTVDFIKVDVEGADLSVLESAKEIIGKNKSITYVEVSEDNLSRYNHSVKDLEDFLSSFGYHFFKNIGKRNSGTDEYTIGRLTNLTQGFSYGEKHYNVLAVHPESDRYPKKYKSRLYTRLYLLFKQVKGFIRNKIK